MDQQLQDDDKQKSTTRFRVNNQVMIESMDKFYRIDLFKPLANGLQFTVHSSAMSLASGGLCQMLGLKPWSLADIGDACIQLYPPTK
jgi:hypothetical protein